MGNLQDFLTLRVLFLWNVPKRGKPKNRQKQEFEKKTKAHTIKQVGFNKGGWEKIVLDLS